eukprot:scaffold1541_cov418-Prasinococcus_capsulatus_cf.AAC.20
MGGRPLPDRHRTEAPEFAVGDCSGPACSVGPGAALRFRKATALALLLSLDGQAGATLDHRLHQAESVALGGPLAHPKPLLVLQGRPPRDPERCQDYGGASYPGGEIMMKYSEDMGQTWSEGTVIMGFEDSGAIAKVTANRLLVTDQGTWLLPIWREGHTANDTGQACASVLRSEDSGHSWIETGCWAADGRARWLIENTIAQSTEDHAIMQVRRLTLRTALRVRHVAEHALMKESGV